MLDKQIYWIKNLPAHIRAMIYGTENGDGRVTYKAELKAVVTRGGKDVDLGVISRRVVTTAGVNYMRDTFAAHAGAADIQNFKYHGCGTGAVAENITDTALGAESTTILTPASTRATGTQVNSTSAVYQTVGTLTFTGAGGAITEHGIFSQAATGGGTLWDRSVFAAINVVSGDSITFTYTLTISAGG